MQENFLDILIGEKLSSVTFVMDYLQIDFDGNRFTFYIYPVVKIDNVDYRFDDLYYRDKLCSLIGKNVVKTTFIENKNLIIEFADYNQLLLSLDSNNPKIVAEIGTFTDIKGRWYVFE